MENAISFVRNFKGIDGWEQAEITEDKSRKIQEQLRKINYQIFLESLRDSETILKRYIVPYSNSVKEIRAVAERLFEKRAINVLTAYEEFLKAKVERIRNGNSE